MVFVNLTFNGQAQWMGFYRPLCKTEFAVSGLGYNFHN